MKPAVLWLAGGDCHWRRRRLVGAESLLRRHHQLREHAALLNQLVIRPRLNNAALVENHNAIGVLQRRQTMGD